MEKKGAVKGTAAATGAVPKTLNDNLTAPTEYKAWNIDVKTSRLRRLQLQSDRTNCNWRHIKLLELLATHDYWIRCGPSILLYHVDVNQVYSGVLWYQRTTENSVNLCVVMIQQGKGILGSIRCSLAGKSGCLYSSISWSSIWSGTKYVTNELLAFTLQAKTIAKFRVLEDSKDFTVNHGSKLVGTKFPVLGKQVQEWETWMTVNANPTL